MRFTNRFTIALAVLALLLVGAVIVVAQPELHWTVMSGGGTKASSAGLKLDATVGQTATTLVTGGTRQLNAGYWQSFGCCRGIRGDVNSDGTDNDVSDMTFIIDFIFRGGPAPLCPREADLNGDGTVADVIDMTFIIDDIFRGGPSPGAC